MRRDGWLAAALFLMLSLDALGAAEGWNLIKVPGATNFSGVAWYRAWVKVPDSYFAKHERICSKNPSECTSASLLARTKSG